MPATPVTRPTRPSRHRRRTAAVVVALAGPLVLAACGGGSPEVAGQVAPATPGPLDDATVEELHAQAREEGTVSVYSFTSRIADVEAVFEETYPGVDLVPTDISSTEQVARITAEAQAGAPGADVAYLSDAPVVQTDLVDTGLLRGYVPPRLRDAVPAGYASPLLAQRLSTKVLMYNEDAHPDGPPVTNLWELTQPEWRGRVVMVDPAVRGDYLDLVTQVALASDEMAAAHEALLGAPVDLDEGVPDAGSQWVADLLANDVVLVDDTDTVNAAVGTTGQAQPPVGFTSYSDIRDNEDEGWALQVAAGTEPSPGIAFPALLGIADGAEHPAAARLVVDFLMGDDSPTGGPGFEPFYVPGDYPVRTDVTPPEGAVGLEELGAWQIDPAEVAARRAEMADFVLSRG